jgi:inorganic triphosphatase YgiF
MRAKRRHEEIELKLLASPAGLDEIANLPLTRELQAGESTSCRQVSTHYDTPHHTLRKNGIALRIRRHAGGYEQTVKVAVHGPVGVQRFLEWTGQLPGDQPCADIVPDRDIRAALKLGGRDRRLGPVFTTDIERRRIPLESGGAKIEVALDHGSITTPGGAKEAVCEIGLERVSGRFTALFKLALQYNRAVGLQPGQLNKAERGYLLARPSLVQDCYKADKPALDAELSVSDAFAAIMDDALGHLRANEGPVAAGHPGGVHQARVAIRRIRAALRAFRHCLKPRPRKRFNRELRWFQGQLSPARDWHVFVDETLPAIRAAYPGRSATTAELRRFALDRRRQATVDVADLFTSSRYMQFLLEFSNWLAQQRRVIDAAAAGMTLAEFAAARLDTTSREFLADTRPLSRMSPGDRHTLRKRGKKARYACEFFAALWPGRATDAYLRSMKNLQESLGVINDISVAAQTAALFRENGVDTRASRLVEEWSGNYLKARLHQAQPDWRRFQKREPFWRGEHRVQ